MTALVHSRLELITSSEETADSKKIVPFRSKDQIYNDLDQIRTKLENWEDFNQRFPGIQWLITSRTIQNKKMPALASVLPHGEEIICGPVIAMNEDRCGIYLASQDCFMVEGPVETFTEKECFLKISIERALKLQLEEGKKIRLPWNIHSRPITSRIPTIR
jgi:hypothetical protein